MEGWGGGLGTTQDVYNCVINQFVHSVYPHGYSVYPHGYSVYPHGYQLTLLLYHS